MIIFFNGIGWMNKVVVLMIDYNQRNLIIYKALIIEIILSVQF